MMLMLPRSLEQAARAVSPASARACTRPCMHLGMNCRMAHLATSYRMRFLVGFFIQFLARFCRKLRGRINMVLALVLGIVPHCNERGSRLALPAPLLVRLPISHLEAAGLGLRPAHACVLKRIRVLAVEQQHDTRIACGILGHRRA